MKIMFSNKFPYLFLQNYHVHVRLLSASSALYAKPLEGKVALVTGASRGIGRGIALQLGENGAKVYITGRKPAESASATSPEYKLPTLEKTADDIKKRGGQATPIYCDHSKHEEIEKLFDQISKETSGKLDILVNSAFSAGQKMYENSGKKFFKCDPLFWDDVNNVGLRNNYISSVHAARMMAKQRKGLIVNISAAGGIQYVFNVPYGVGKCAVDRLSADTALELKDLGITVISLWPGTVKTEFSTLMLEKGLLDKALGLPKDLVRRLIENGETPQFVGRAVVALASDPSVIKKTGTINMTSDLASEYKFTDIDGRLPTHMRSVKTAMEFLGWPNVAKIVPSFLKAPGVAMHMTAYKFYKF